MSDDGTNKAHEARPQDTAPTMLRALPLLLLVLSATTASQSRSGEYVQIGGKGYCADAKLKGPNYVWRGFRGANTVSEDLMEISACVTECDARPECVAIEFEPDLSSTGTKGRCYLLGTAFTSENVAAPWQFSKGDDGATDAISRAHDDAEAMDDGNENEFQCFVKCSSSEFCVCATNKGMCCESKDNNCDLAENQNADVKCSTSRACVGCHGIAVDATTNNLVGLDNLECSEPVVAAAGGGGEVGVPPQQPGQPRPAATEAPETPSSGWSGTDTALTASGAALAIGIAAGAVYNREKIGAFVAQVRGREYVELGPIDDFM